VEFDPANHPDITRYTEAALRDVRAQAEASYQTLTAAVTPETVTDEQLDQLDGYKVFTAAVDAELAGALRAVERYRLQARRPAAVRGYHHLRSWALRPQR